MAIGHSLLGLSASEIVDPNHFNLRCRVVLFSGWHLLLSAAPIGRLLLAQNQLFGCSEFSLQSVDLVLFLLQHLGELFAGRSLHFVPLVNHSLLEALSLLLVVVDLLLENFDVQL